MRSSSYEADFMSDSLPKKDAEPRNKVPEEGIESEEAWQEICTI